MRAWIRMLLVGIAVLSATAIEATPVQATPVVTSFGIQNPDFSENCGTSKSAPGFCQPLCWTVTKASSKSCYLFGKNLEGTGVSGFAFGAGSQKDDIVSQTFLDTPGLSTLSFCSLRNICCSVPFCSSCCNHFNASFGPAGGTLQTLVCRTNFKTPCAFTHFTFTVTATGDDTISFAGFDKRNYFDPTNVQLQAGAPEIDPSTSALPTAIGLGLLCIVADRRRKGSVQAP